MPRLETLYTELKGRGFVLVAVNIEEPERVVRKWARANAVTFPVVLDRDGAVTERYRVFGTPTVYLVDREGRLVGRGVGPREWSGKKGRGLLDGLLAQ